MRWVAIDLRVGSHGLSTASDCSPLEVCAGVAYQAIVAAHEAATRAEHELMRGLMHEVLQEQVITAFARLRTAGGGPRGPSG